MPTLAEARARVETDLDDATLATIIDAETEWLTRQIGAEAETETQLASGLQTIVLKRKPASITAVTERRTHASAAVALTADDDWRQMGNYGLRRIGAYWGAEVVIEYVPDIDLQLRERVLLDLIQLSVEFRAFETEEVGDYKRSETQGAYTSRRKALVAQLSEGRGLFV